MQRDANIYKAQGRCLSTPGAVLNLLGAADRQAEKLTDR